MNNTTGASVPSVTLAQFPVERPSEFNANINFLCAVIECELTHLIIDINNKYNPTICTELHNLFELQKSFAKISDELFYALGVANEKQA
ncbi:MULTISPECIES: hypothetical protein [Klebsiella]|uniref:Uncharacterized protein n=1 Tax=Klebsiella quasipneumoniae subsp. quasipneumoniae TaxID=1667327 RepID=A0AAW8XIQ0_9ENTR|nr:MULTISPECIES: hypothetical protein [Klebsiella]ELT0943069.1 hypothetical protein [Klebsiella quasipneumoniae]MBM5556503.1 hypothetical protein [Klebsiella quasipneumoniae]MBM5562006.1 hypothetical protein [Klebsiella quasipneumoniae]MCF8598903.1 hypothetical protein [Klebsiella sp. 2019SCSN059]MCJ4447847.1 hypothetical protein [Klebsiella quasipneumoniae]